MKRLLLSIASVLCLSVASAQVPGTLSYQGILVNSSGDPVADGPHYVQFGFFNASTGGTTNPCSGCIYSSLGTGSGNTVTTYKGMFTFIIGSGSTGNVPIPTNIWDNQVYVEVIADGAVLTPRVQLTSNAYAFKAESANTMDAADLTGTLAPARIAAGTLDNTKLASDLDASKLASGTLPIARIADGAVTSLKITDATITNADISASAAIAGTKIDGTTLTTVSATNITTGTLPAAQIGAASIDNTKLASGIDAAKITTGTLPAARIGAGSITTAEILNGTIATADLADGSVTTLKLATSGVTAASYGSATSIPTFAVDASGRITSVTPVALGGGTVTNVTGTLPISVATGTSTPAISISQAGAAANGYLSSTDWNTFNNKANVPSSQAANAIFAAPSGSAGTPLFRSLTPLDVPNLDAGKITTGTLPLTRGGTGGTDAASARSSLGLGAVALFSAIGSTEITDGSIAAADLNTMGATANQVLQYSGTAWAPVSFSGASTASNGLTLSSNDVKLGGALTGATTIASAGNNLMFNGTGKMGIGSPTPQSKLSVGGSVTIGNTYADANAAPVSGLLVEGSVGIGTPTPTRAVLEQHGQVGSTTAIFGGNGQGVSLAINSPGVGFNTYFDAGGTKAIGIGFGSSFTFNTSTGDLYYYASTASALANGLLTTPNKLTILNSGRVGIGTTTPTSQLDVEGGVTIGSNYSGTNAAPTNGAIIEGNLGIGTFTATYPLSITSTNTTRAIDVLNNYSGTSNQSGMKIDMTSATGNGVKVGIDLDVTGTAASTSALRGVNSNITPGSGSALIQGLKSVVNAAGSGVRNGVQTNVLSIAGNTSSIVGVDAATSGTGTGSHYGVSATAAGAGPFNYGLLGGATGAAAGSVNYGVYGSASGAPTNWAGYFPGNTFVNVLYGPSDEKLKHDIKPFEESSLELLGKINIKSYHFNEGGDFDLMHFPKGEQIGLLAADFEKVFPGLVTQAVTDLSVLRGNEKKDPSVEDKITFKAVNYTGLVPYLVKAIQEQQDSIVTLKNRLKELEDRSKQVDQVFTQLDEIKKEMELYRSILGVQTRKKD